MTNLIRNRWLPFKEARRHVRKTNIKTEMEWKCQRKYLPSFIPRDPHIFYKKEWKGFSDWLGTNNIRGQLRKYKVNDNFFSKWSKDMAYVLGFWWADGYIRERKDGRFKKGVSGNPNGRQRSEWRDELEDAIRVVQGKKRKKLMIHIVEQAYKDNRVLVALLKKLLPDLKTGELNISGEISLKPPTIA